MLSAKNIFVTEDDISWAKNIISDQNWLILPPISYVISYNTYIKYDTYQMIFHIK